MARLRGAPLHEAIDLTTIGSLTDVVVPADHATGGGARHTIVETSLLDGHGDVLTDADALRAVRAALEGRPLPCRSFAAFLRGAVVPRAISAVESLPGDVAAAVPGGTR
jgi:hypothetical protein